MERESKKGRKYENSEKFAVFHCFITLKFIILQLQMKGVRVSVQCETGMFGRLALNRHNLRNIFRIAYKH